MSDDENKTDDLNESALVESLLAAPRVDDMENPYHVQLGRQIARSITMSIDAMRSASKAFPNKHINELMDVVWDLVNNEVIPVAASPHVKSISFVLLGSKVSPRLAGAVLVPWNWMEMVSSDPEGFLGGIVFVGSQCCDYYNSKLYSKEQSDDSVQRSHAYEAEYLLTILKMSPKYPLTEYQENLLKEFPQGLNGENIKHLLYTSKQFTTQQGSDVC